MRVRTLNAKDFKCEAFRVTERGRQQRKIMDAMKEEIQRKMLGWKGEMEALSITKS